MEYTTFLPLSDCASVYGRFSDAPVGAILQVRMASAELPVVGMKVMSQAPAMLLGLGAGHVGTCIEPGNVGALDITARVKITVANPSPYPFRDAKIGTVYWRRGAFFLLTSFKDAEWLVCVDSNGGDFSIGSINENASIEKLIELGELKLRPTRCPSCDENISPRASVCPRCRRDVPD